jgi:hypothetical protein
MSNKTFLITPVHKKMRGQVLRAAAELSKSNLNAAGRQQVVAGTLETVV